MKNQTVNLPSSVSELKEALRTGIAFYQGNPAKNENKLNEALALALHFKNYDSLSPLLNLDGDIKVAKHTATIDDDNNVFIDGQLIDEIIFAEEKVSYRVRTKEEVVDNIFDWVAGAKSSDRKLMIEDIKLLQGSSFENDEFILDSIETNKYLFRHVSPEEFDDFCEEVLELNKEFAEIPRCPNCHAALNKKGSVSRTYYSKGDGDNVTLEGEYVGKDQCFESGYALPSGRYEYDDDSDSCVNCDHAL